jgi:hypothetical protein
VIADAPADGTIYGRTNNNWSNTLLRYDAVQALSALQQQQARQNIYVPPFDAMSHNGLQLNGACDVNQLSIFSSIYASGTNVALGNATNQAMCDQWVGSRQNTPGAFNLTWFSSGGPPGIPAYLQLTSTTAASSIAAGDSAILLQPIEGYRWQRLAFGTSNAQPITISFWMYCTTGGGTFSITVRNFNGTRSYVANLVHNNTGWEYKTVTVPGDTAGTWAVGAAGSAIITFCFMCGTTYQAPAPNTWSAGNYYGTSANTNFFSAANNYVAITGLTVHPGSEGPSAARSPFVMRPYDEELMACMRYSETGRQLYAYMAGLACTAAYGNIPFKVPKFTSPTINNSGTWNYWSGAGYASFTPSGFSSSLYDFTFQLTGATNWCGWGNTGLWYCNARMV